MSNADESEKLATLKRKDVISEKKFNKQKKIRNDTTVVYGFRL